MKKNPSLFHSFLLAIALILSFVAVFTLFSLTSCKKNDFTTDEALVDTRQNFFDGHRSADPTERMLVEYIRRQNEQMNFVEKTVNQIGFPRWNKTVTILKKNSHSTGRNQNGDTTIYYIPFVRDSQNYVNASMAIKIAATDTSFYYLCDWQYSQLQNDQTSISDVAEHYAVFFMNLDKIVFGYNKFKINNSHLFHGDFTGPVKVRLIDGDSNVNELYSVFTCQNVVISYQDCPYGSGQCSGLNGTCDNCWRCTSSVQYQYCTETWIDDGGGGGGGGGGTGGGGGPGGGGTPPDCGDPQGRIAARGNEPCEEGPGWEPLEDEPIPPPHDPCNDAKLAARKLDTLYNNGKVDSMLATIPNLTTEPNEKGFAIFRKFSVNPQNMQDTVFTTYKTSQMFTGTPSSINPIYNIPYLSVKISFVHTHTKDAYSAQSAADIYKLIESKLEDPYLVGNLAVASDGSKYGVTITDPALAVAFLNTKSLFLNGSKWNDTSAIGKAFDIATNYFLEKFNGVANQKDLAYEMAMAAVLNQFNIGITLSKRDNSGHFKPIMVKKAILNPNNPKKITYIQDCQ